MGMEMDMLRAELAKAQQAAKDAKGRIDMVNAQEVVDALYDRIDRQKMLDARAVQPRESEGMTVSPWGTTKEEDQAVIDRLIKKTGKKGMPVRQSWEQVELHEL